MSIDLLALASGRWTPQGGIIAALMLALATPSCSDSCTEIGCNSGVTAGLGGDVVSTDVALVRMCLNGECVELEWVGDGGCQHSRSGELDLTACAEGDSLSLQLFFGTDLARDGDTIRVVVEDEEGSVLVSEEQVVEYSDVYPNGADCNGHCRTATVQL